MADYSYSGAMVNRITSRMRRHPDQFKNLVATSSGSWDEYSWKSEFTDAFVRHNKEGRRTKCVADVFEVSAAFSCTFMYFTSKLLIDWGGRVLLEHAACARG